MNTLPNIGYSKQGKLLSQDKIVGASSPANLKMCFAEKDLKKYTI